MAVLTELEAKNEMLVGRVEISLSDNLPPLPTAVIQLAEKNLTADRLLRKLGLEQRVSAYFSFHPQNKTLLIEWGKILPDGERKLHGYLAEMDTFGFEAPIALIDSLYLGKSILEKADPEYPMVTTLWQHGFLVIGSDGTVIKTREMVERDKEISHEIKTFRGFRRIISDPRNSYFDKVAALVLANRLEIIEGKRVVPRSKKEKEVWVKRMIERRTRAVV